MEKKIKPIITARKYIWASPEPPSWWNLVRHPKMVYLEYINPELYNKILNCPGDKAGATALAYEVGAYVEEQNGILILTRAKVKFLRPLAEITKVIYKHDSNEKENKKLA